MHLESQKSIPPRGTISVIIPVWRDHGKLGSLLPFLTSGPEVAEVIVSFAEADPAAVRMVQDHGATAISAGEPNRGRQLDLGASEATGDWLLFHHADTELTREHLLALARLGDDAETVGGAFYRKFDERHPGLRWLEPIERWHNRTCGALFGDQSIFVRREVFRRLGGFRALPLMEDVDFSRRLRRAGRIALLDPSISSSPRKHLTHGPWRTTWTNATLLLLYHLGVPPQRLHAWYYRRGASSLWNATNQPAQPSGISEPPGASQRMPNTRESAIAAE